jgi:hypothetical protein
MIKVWKSMLAGVASAGLPFLLLATGAGQAQTLALGEAKTVTGVVKDYTTAPKGEVDGAILNDGTVLHWPPDLQDRFQKIVIKGERVRATGSMDNTPDGFKLEVRTVTNVRTGKSAENDAPAPPVPPPATPERRGLAGPGKTAMQTATGRIRSMMKAPMGEVDGAVLDDGTVIHWPPHLADRFSSIVAVGDRVKATGSMDKTPDGPKLEIQTLTNLRTDKSVDNDSPPPPEARRPGAERAGNREQRIQNLEGQLQQIQKELDQLRREK